MQSASMFWRHFLRRVNAYRRLFQIERAGAARLSGDGEIVIADLRQFCCVERGTAQYDHRGRLDPYATAKNEGRREVYERIVGSLRLDESEIQRVRATANTNPED